MPRKTTTTDETPGFDLATAVKVATIEDAPDRRTADNPFAAPLADLIDRGYQNTRTGFGVTVPEDQVSRVRGMLTRASADLGVSAFVGRKEDGEGMVRLVVTVRDRVTRPRKEADSE